MAIKMKSGNGWVPVPGTAGTFATPTKRHERVTLTEAATVIPIGLALREGDFLTVLRENLPLVEGQNYTRGDGSITLTKAGEPGDTFDFFVMHYELAPTRGHVDDRENPHGVTAAQLGDDALTEGSLLKIKAGKLTKAVPGADYQALPETIPLTLKSPWREYEPLTYGAAAARKSGGVVTLSGLIEGGPKTTSVIATLPEGWRPEKARITSTFCLGGRVRVDIQPTGDIRLIGLVSANGDPTNFTTLSDIAFLL